MLGRFGAYQILTLDLVITQKDFSWPVRNEQCCLERNSLYYYFHIKFQRSSYAKCVYYGHLTNTDCFTIKVVLRTLLADLDKLQNNKCKTRVTNYFV